jgi:hypothetical protein
MDKWNHFPQRRTRLGDDVSHVGNFEDFAGLNGANSNQFDAGCGMRAGQFCQRNLQNRGN